MCCDRRRCLFGDVTEGTIQLSAMGRVVEARWHDLPNHTPGLLWDEFVVMPNHLHGIIVLPGSAVENAPASKPSHGPGPGSLGAVIGGFKSAVSRELGISGLRAAHPVWQRNYFERVIRNDRELDAIRRYITANPLRWEEDPEHPSTVDRL